jgi:sugar phosphate isomerase/epimerase
MQWLSLRDVPSTEAKKNSYHLLEPSMLQQAKAEFKDAGIGISFLDTPFLKFTLPGTEPKRSRPEEPTAKEKRLAREKTEFDNRLADLRLGIRACHAFDCPQLRIFTFTRVAEPESLFPRIAEIIGELSAVAEKEGVRLLIENEASQNAGTSAETAKLIKLLPRNVGINWDSLNGLALGEKPYPDGYESLPKDRNWNVHVKGKSVLDYPEHQDWPAILSALERDGFTGRLELETHIFGDQQVAASHASMKEIMRLLTKNG